METFSIFDGIFDNKYILLNEIYSNKAFTLYKVKDLFNDRLWVIKTFHKYNYSIHREV